MTIFFLILIYWSKWIQSLQERKKEIVIVIIVIVIIVMVIIVIVIVVVVILLVEASAGENAKNNNSENNNTNEWLILISMIGIKAINNINNYSLQYYIYIYTYIHIYIYIYDPPFICSFIFWSMILTYRLIGDIYAGALQQFDCNLFALN